MEKLALNLCLIAPNQPALCHSYRWILHLLKQNRESVGIVIVSRGLDSIQEEANWTTVKSLTDLESNEGEPDLYLCWDLPVLNELLLCSTRRQPLVYAMTIGSMLQGVIPVHPRIVGYLSDVPFLRGILMSCGIPLNRQFSLAAWIDTADGASPEPVVPRMNSVLLISDDAVFSSTVMAACEVLGMGLERLSYAAWTQGISPEFYVRFGYVIAAGWPALQAAAAGATVIVADERGSAGLLTQDNLSRVLEAQAGPACFESPVGTETILSALADSRVVDTTGLAQLLCMCYSETARAHQFTVWLQQVCKNVEAANPGHGASAAWPQLLSISAMTGATDGWVSTAFGAAANKCSNSSSLPPVSEVLVECTAFIESVSPPCLPFGRYIAANEEQTLTGFFAEGWSGSESWGRWSDSREATVQFVTDAMGDSIELILHLHPFLPPGRLFQRVMVRVNGCPLLCWRLDFTKCNTPLRLLLGPDCLDEKKAYRIRFDLPDASTPQSWGKKDVRLLGLGLSGLELRRMSE